MTGQSSKILCIDDDPGIIELLCEFLAEEGFAPIVARDGVDGVKKFSEHPDAILCDVDMPSMDGFSVLRELRRSDYQLSSIPFLFITAYGSRESNLRARRLGCDDFIAKPLDFELLIEILRNRLASKSRSAPPLCALTDREREIMIWVSRGKSSHDIGAILGLSARTVNFHVNNVLQKLCVATRLQAALRCSLLRLIEP
jgi:DNA-binding NarL/FixJ family response regulator